MNLKQITDRLLDKWLIKLLCLSLAVILYIFHQVSAVEKKSFVIPLTIIENGSVTHVDGKKKSVTVIIRANPDQISQVHPSDIKASVNLDALPKSGEYSVPVNIDMSEELLMNNPFEIQVSPEFVKVKVEKKDVQFIKIIPSIAGECKYGYEVKEVSISPEFVEVIGPESLLLNTAEIKTDLIDISDKNKSFTVTTNALEVSNAINITDKGPYTVKVDIAPIELEKTFENVIVSKKGLSEQFIIKGENPVINYKLSGPLDSLEKYEPSKDSVYIDLSNISSSGVYDLPVSIYVPSAYKLIEQSLDTISVTVDEYDPTALIVDENSNLILE